MTGAPARRPPAGPGLFGSGVLVAVGIAVGQVLGYALLVLGARLLGPSVFGELGTLMGLLTIGAVVPLAVQTVTARRVAGHDVGSDPPTLARLGMLAAVVVTVVALAFVPVAVAVLDLDPLATTLVALTLFPLTVAYAGAGLAQGRQLFGVLAVIYAVLALGRTGAAVLALITTYSVRAVMVATLAGTVVAWLLVQRRSGLPWRWSRGVPRPVTVELSHATHALLAMFVFTNADLLLARARLTPEDAGVYAAGAIILKIAFWLPQAVAVVVFPSLAEGRAGAMSRGAGVVVGLGLAVTAAVAFLGPWLLPFALGPGYAAITGEAWLFGLAGTAQAVVYLLLFGRLAAQDRLAAIAMWVAVLALGGIVVLSGASSPRDVVVAVLGVSLVLCVAGAWAHARRSDQPGSASR